MPEQHELRLGKSLAVATLVIGPHTVEQLRQNVQLVSNYRPLSDEQQAKLAEFGRQLADRWGEHYGPVA